MMYIVLVYIHTYILKIRPSHYIHKLNFESTLELEVTQILGHFTSRDQVTAYRV